MILNPTISVVPSATDTTTTDVSIEDILDGIGNGRWSREIKAVRDAYAKGGKSAADVPKRALPGALFSGTFSRRASDGLREHSGLICVDLDHLGPQLEGIRDIVGADPHTLAAFVSPTGTGLKVVFRCNPHKPHIESYRAAERYVLEHFGLQIDAACKDVARICFVSYDPDILVAENAEELPYPPPVQEFKAPAEKAPAAKLLAGTTPGDDFDARGDVPSLLLSHGWVKVGKHGWRRPGKESGISATWDHVPSRFYVFSSSTSFSPNHVYRGWHVYAFLEHGGNFSAAARALAGLGFGEQRNGQHVAPRTTQVIDLDGDEPAQPTATTTALPYSSDSERQLLECVFADGAAVMPKANAANLGAGSFYDQSQGRIFGIAMRLWKAGHPINSAVVIEELKQEDTLERVGGAAMVEKLSAATGNVANADYLIGRVRDLAMQRAAIRTLEEVLADARKGIPDLGALTTRFSELGARQPGALRRPLTAFVPPPDGDGSVLLGNRYLNRGDGAVLVSSSGMGKSSLSIQMAVQWALGVDAFGIKSNGPLRSLIVQSEDSDGDVGEMWVSMMHRLELSEHAQATVADRVSVVSERVLRGDNFILSLRQHIKEHKPDLVWINPLQAFMDGDVTESKDLGRFLREQLNGLNQDASFGYVIVHHTTKPATGKERGDRQWHEVMYDMAGGAEIINWARAVISLRASPTEGDFNLVLAKRGRRAGVVRRVEDGLNTKDEIVTTIPLRHAKGTMAIAGRAKPMGVIFWEERAADEEESPPTGPAVKRATTAKLADYINIFPPASSQGQEINALHRSLTQNRPINKTALHEALKEWIEKGQVVMLEAPQRPNRYRLAR